MAEFIFITQHELDLNIAALYAASDVATNYDRDFDALNAFAPEDYDDKVIKRARDLMPLIDDDGNVFADTTLVMPTAFVRFVEADTLYLAVIDFEGVAGVIEASEDPRDIPDIIRYMLRSSTRHRNVDAAIAGI